MSGDSRTLRLVRERKLTDLLPPLRFGLVLEASGVVATDGMYFVVFDNIRRIARVGPDLDAGSPDHLWMGRLREGEGYEDIAYSREQKRFYALIEAEKHPDGSYKAVIEEYDHQFRYKGRRWVQVPFEKRNRGFEGLSAIRVGGTDYLLALCEGNEGRSGLAGSTPGAGRIHVLRQVGQLWQSVTQIRLPSSLDFEDYSAIALRDRRMVVVSQKSSRIWVGKLRRENWTIAGEGRTYELPRTPKGKRVYCTVEGIDWLTPTTFVMVSDLRKKGYPDRCSRTDQSIHVFRVPSGK